MTGRYSRGRWAAVAARPWLATAAWAALLFVLGLVRVFVPRPVGLADDGSGAPLACWLGIAPDTDDRYFAFAVFRWLADDGPCAHDTTTAPPWPQLAGLSLVRVVSTALGTAELDLRASSVFYCALAALLAALVGQLARRRRYGRAVTAGLTWFLLMDASFVGYAASLYPQAAGIAGLFLCTSGWLLLDTTGRGRGRGLRGGWVGWGVLGLGGAVLVSSGPVAALAVVPIGVALVLRAYRARGRSRWAGWAVPVALTIVLAGLAADAGVDPGPPQPTWDVPSGPAALYDRLDRTVDAMGDGRPDGLGSFDEAGDARPGEQEQRVTLFSSRQAQLSALGPPGAIVSGILLAWLAVVIVRSPVHGRNARRLAAVALVLLGIAVSQVVGTVLLDTAVPARHVVVGSLAAPLSLCLLVAAGLTSRALDAAARPAVARVG